MQLNNIITIRPAIADDLPDVINIEQEASAFPWTCSAFNGTLVNEHGISLVALDIHGKVCGYIFSVIIAEELEIHNIAVHPDFRRRHIGEQLLITLLTLAQQRYVTRVFLEVRSKNIPAQALYAKLGFITQLIRRNYYSGDNDDALIMLLSLHDA
jgi:ribosomal-protein-alanine N-acetyltransferase